MRLFRTTEDRQQEIANRVVARRETLTPVDVTVNHGETAQVWLSNTNWRRAA